MNFLWLIIPLVVALPLFLLTMFVSITASYVQLNVRKSVPSRVSAWTGDPNSVKD